MPAAMTPDEAGKLIVTGLTFGCIHVLAGADHLSALATLAVGSKWKAFSLGIRWGLGHSTGLIIVAAIILGLGDRIDPKVLEHACSWIVGVFMILLGVWGIVKARKHEVVRQAATAVAAAAAAAEGVEGGKERGDDALQQQEEGRGGRGGDDLGASAGVGSPMRVVIDPSSTAAAAAVTSTPSSSSSSTEDEEEGMGTELIPPLQFNSAGGGGGAAAGGEMKSEGGDHKEDKEEEEEEEERIRKSSNSSTNNNNTARQIARSSSSSSSTTSITNLPSFHPPQHHKHEISAEEPFLDEECEELDHWLLIRARQCLHLDIESPAVQRIVAFSVGIIHGIAGPGGVLGVLPAARLHSWPKASLYLATFCLTSTLIMGVFAAVYGECTSRIGSAAKIEFRLELFSASLSIIVGVLWMALIIAGKLDVVFG